MVNLVGDHASGLRRFFSEPTESHGSPYVSDIEGYARPVSGWLRRVRAADNILTDAMDCVAVRSVLLGAMRYVYIVFLCLALDKRKQYNRFSCVLRWTQETNIIGAAPCECCRTGVNNSDCRRASLQSGRSRPSFCHLMSRGHRARRGFFVATRRRIQQTLSTVLR
eukprot:SAG31_NODE_7953_length_1555_cov_2.929945_3_plen_166_part_00